MELSFSLGVQSMLQYVLLKYNCSWINYHLSKPKHNIVSRLAWAPKKVNVAFVDYVAPLPYNVASQGEGKFDCSERG